MRISGLPAGTTVCLLLMAGLAMAARPSLAQSDAYTVYDIAVDATADDAASAQEAALAQGHVDALQAIVARLVPVGERDALPPLEAEDIVEMVQDFSIAEERTSAVRYLAVLTFRFDPGSVRAYLRANGVSFAETRSDPLLVLPIYGAAGSERLWRAPNPWREIWSARNLTAELVPMILPLGDLDDVSAVTAVKALDGDPAGLETIAQRYGAEEVLVSQLILRGNPAGGNARAQVNTTRYSAIASNRFRLDFSQEPEETFENFLARAAAGVADRVQNVWKAQNLLRFGDESKLMATIPVSSLGEWLEVKRRLDQVPIVVRSEIANMTRSAVDVVVTYLGDEDQLARTLEQSNLILTPDLAAGWWQLSLNSGGSQAGSQPSAQ